MLDYGEAVGAPGQAHFGEGSGAIWLERVNCLGTENNLDECEHTQLPTQDCPHSKDAGVICGKKNIDGKGMPHLHDIFP